MLIELKENERLSEMAMDLYKAFVVLKLLIRSEKDKPLE